MKRLSMAAITGCLILFLWGGFSHMVLFIGAGFTPMPNEEKITNVLQSSLPGKGLYFFPGKDFQHVNPRQDAAFNEKFRNGPVGILVYRPVGGDPVASNNLVTQLACTFLTTVILAVILSLLAVNYWKRVLTAGVLGFLACVSVSSIYWNWYDFPDTFFLAQIADQVVGYLVAGAVIAKILPAFNTQV